MSVATAGPVAGPAVEKQLATDLVKRGLIVAPVLLLVADAGWVAKVPLGVTLIVTHLGLLLWETKYVSASLAFPGLKPNSPKE
jgi:hypothetical protein